MRTGGGSGVGGGDARVAADAGGGPGVSALLVADVCGGGGAVVIPDYGDDDGIVDSTTKRGANMTERVPVPSSEHVAEIVGRQGKHIQALWELPGWGVRGFDPPVNIVNPPSYCY